MLISAFLLLNLVTLVTKSSAQSQTEAELCRAHRNQCERGAKANNRMAVLDACQNCFLNCKPLIKQKQNKSQTISAVKYCLDTGVKYDCIGHEAANRVRMVNKFRCYVSRRHCFHDDKDKGQGNDIVKKSCGACAKVCNSPLARNHRNFCESRCSTRNFSCTPSSDSKGNASKWKWSGPVLVAVFVIVDVIITVVWMCYCKHAKFAGLAKANASPLPPMELGYDQGWPNPEGTLASQNSLNKS